MSSQEKAFRLVGYFVGLQLAYLTWGVVQERVMTHAYRLPDGSTERFRDSQFLVFVNRFAALLLAVAICMYTEQPPHVAPIYKYSYSSLSNILSSWCQYEALKFVDFPTQVLAKSCKIIPVMLMGRVVQKRVYGWNEYLTAAMISAGVCLFMLTNPENKSSTAVTTTTGLLLLAGYVLFDSFTSNWQDALFTEYSISPFQLMAGVNLFSVVFTAATLLVQGGFVEGWHFLTTYPIFLAHMLLTAFTSAIGQILIFTTIAHFGPAVFTIIMTVRQALAILLSCLIYHHVVSLLGFVGLMVVFLALFLRIYISYRQSQLRKQQIAQLPLRQ